MGTGKKEATRRERQGKGDGMNNIKVKGENFYRSAKRVKTLNSFKNQGPQRDASGKITKAAPYQSREIPVARVEPNRKWWNTTRVIGQDALQAFRTAVAEQARDPYSVLLKTNKLPMSLIRDGQGKTVNGIKQHAAKVAVEATPFKETFGPKANRKRVKLNVGSMEEMAGEAGKMLDTYEERKDQERLLSGAVGDEAVARGEDVREEDDGTVNTARESIFSKGQSKRIWTELYKVIDSSDVLLHVLDARDPMSTRCRSVEKYLREEAPHKHLVFVLNKCDLVPTSVAANWVRVLSKEVPTLAMHASLTNSFGKGSMISLLRQFASLHKGRRQVSVGMVGYPNVGKSSIINTLRSKKVATVAPIPGETKVWATRDEDVLLRGCVRIENVEMPSQYIDAVLGKVKRVYLERTYGIKGWESGEQFLEMLARKGGRLLKAGEADKDQVARMVINDMCRGKLPWYTPPPPKAEDEAKADGEASGKKDGVEASEGVSETSRKRKREEKVPEEKEKVETLGEADSSGEEFGDEDFEGFEVDVPEDLTDDSDDGDDNDNDDIDNDTSDDEEAEQEQEEANSGSGPASDDSNGSGVELHDTNEETAPSVSS